MSLLVSTLAGLFGSGSAEGSTFSPEGVGKVAAPRQEGETEAFAAALLAAMGPEGGTGERVEALVRHFLSQDAGTGEVEGDSGAEATEGDAGGEASGEEPPRSTPEGEGRVQAREPQTTSRILTESDEISSNSGNPRLASGLTDRSSPGLGTRAASPPAPVAPSRTASEPTAPSEPRRVGAVRGEPLRAEASWSAAARSEATQKGGSSWKASRSGRLRSEATSDVSQLQGLQGGVGPKEAGLSDPGPSQPRVAHDTSEEGFIVDASSARGAGAGVVSATAPESLLATDRDLSQLEPEFRHRLERVIQRMETEYGHRVEVVEGYRTPERQDFLYTQGRTRSGPVVTWTRDSLHSQGRAADLQIDGSWQNHQGYSRLQRIASEEGLNTLGAKDPGHLELPTSDGKSGRNEGTRMASETTRPWSTQAPGPIGARRVAAPARVARPAAVARVAAVATPGAGKATIRARDGSTGKADEGGSAREMGSRARVKASVPQHDTRPVAPEAPPRRAEERDVRRRDGTGEVVRTGPSQPEPVSTGGGRSWAEPAAPKAVSAPAAPAAAGAQRVEEVLSVREASEMAPPRFMHLDLENADGAGTRLRLDLRGSNLDATIDLQDPVSAERMRARINGLHRALARVGLDAESIRIQAPRVPLEGMEGLKDIQPGVGEAFRLTALGGITNSRSTSPEGSPDGRSQQGHTAQGGQDQSRPRNPHQRNQAREERR